MDGGFSSGDSVGRKEVLRHQKKCTQVPDRNLQRLHKLLARLHQHDTATVLEVDECAFAHLHRSSRIQLTDKGPQEHSH